MVLRGNKVRELWQAPAKSSGGRDTHSLTLSLLRDNDVGVLDVELTETRPVMLIGLVRGDWYGEEMSSNSCAEPLDAELSPQMTRTLTAGVGETGEGKSVSRGVGWISTTGLELQWVPAISLWPVLSSVVLKTIKWPPFVPAKSRGWK